MATAMLALVESEELDYPEPEECISERETPRGSRRLLETYRAELEAEIEQARNILNEPQAAPEECGFYSEQTLERAVGFLRTHIEWLWRSYGVKVGVPTIGPGPNESVDLYWQTPSWRLLVNIPSNVLALATFYGDDNGRQKSKGSFDPESLSGSIAACLMA